MRITKVMLEEQVRRLQDELKRYHQENDRLKLRSVDQERIIQTYSGMTSFTIACERISDALAHTISDLKKR